MRVKEYTDLEQSKKLAEILSIESANGYWKNGKSDKLFQFFDPFIDNDLGLDDVPCWSLTALMDAMKFDFNLEKFEFDQSDYFTYSVVFELDQTKIRTREHENAIDACYEMILKLHEQGYELKY